MRQITREATESFYGFKHYKKSNTEVKIATLGVQTIATMYLHGNPIATRVYNSDYGAYDTTISNCGWETNTIKERLNALRGVHITQKNFVWYLNGEVWDGSPTQIERGLY